MMPNCSQCIAKNCMKGLGGRSSKSEFSIDQHTLDFFLKCSVEDKVWMTERRLWDWSDFAAGVSALGHFPDCHYPWIGAYLSFSGGIDSCVLLHLIRRVCLHNDIPAVFVNTGLEYPEIVDFVQDMQKRDGNIEIVRPRKSFRKVLENYGYPVVSKDVATAINRYRNTKSEQQRQYRLQGFPNGKKGSIPQKYHYLINAPFGISEKCCDWLKKKPLDEYAMREHRVIITGEMASESNLRMRRFRQGGCNMFSRALPKAKPLSLWTKQDVLQYALDNDVPYCRDIYGDIVRGDNGLLCTTREQRTGCIFCCFGIEEERKAYYRDGSPTRFQRLQKTHPRLYDYCMNKLGMAEVLEFMRVPYENGWEFHGEHRQGVLFAG